MKIRALILDMDGVIWRDKEPIGNLPKIFASIREAGIKFVFATNNASRTSDQHLEKLSSFGIEGLEAWQVVSSSDAVVDYLTENFEHTDFIYTVGEAPLVQKLDKSGFKYSETNAAAVVAGIDRTLTYKKLEIATRLIRKGARFIGTNPDKTFPTAEGLSPGAGSMLAAIEAATDIAPVIVGKPSPRMYEIALRRLGVSPIETLVVGDRIETDIAGSQIIQCKSALVLSGVTTFDQAILWKPAPDLIKPDLESVVNQILFQN